MSDSPSILDPVRRGAAAAAGLLDRLLYRTVATVYAGARSTTFEREPRFRPDSDARGQLAREFLWTGRYAEAEYILWELVRESPRGPHTTYLLGLALLLQGRDSQARRFIERAYALRPWIQDRIPSPRAIETLQETIRNHPDWKWPRYQLERERWRAVDLSLAKAVRIIADELDRPVSFIQVGANDGTDEATEDPLRPIVRKYHLEGLFVEPQPEPFARLQKLYAGLPGARFACVAIAGADGPAELFIAPDRSAIATMVPNRNLMRNHLGTARSITVEGVTFETLRRRYDVDHLDLVQIDAEGLDYQILEQIPLPELNVKIVNMEFYCLPIDERLATYELLHDAGFAAFFDGMDLLAIRRDLFAETFYVTDVVARLSRTAPSPRAVER